MGIYSYEEAFGAGDQTSTAMRNAIRQWFQLYYGHSNGDPCQRVAYGVVSKLVRTVFGEYQAVSGDPFVSNILNELEKTARQAVELSLVGGECYLKPCLTQTGFSFTLIPRDSVLIFGRDPQGTVTDIGTVERSTEGKYYYTLLERRSVDAEGYLTIENKLFRSLNRQNLGNRVSLSSHSRYKELPDVYRYEMPVGSVGLVQVKNPMLNCVDGSADGVSVYAAAVGLIENIDENEAQLREEFLRGQSRIFASRDLLRQDSGGNKLLQDHLFVGLDEDPEQVGITIFSPQLRQQSYLERKQEYLRNVESVIGLKRGMLSDANMEDRTATEISSSAGDYNLTVMDFQRMWQLALAQTVRLCCVLARLYGTGVPPEEPEISIDWGNGILYDEDKTWQDYQNLVSKGLMKPEIALGWRFNMKTNTKEQLQAIRQRFMPGETN